MRVAVYGSWREKAKFDIVGKPEDFRRVSAEIGQLIARLRHTLVLYSINKHLRGDADSYPIVDFYAAKAYLEELRTQDEPRAPLILLAPPYDDPDSQALQREFSDAIRILYNAERKAKQGLGVVVEARRVITLGGSWGTYGVGIAARITRTPFIPIATFGGASRMLSSESTRKDAEFLGQFGGPFGPKQIEQLRIWLGTTGMPRILLIHGHGNEYQKVRTFLTKTLKCPDPIVMKEEFGGGLTLPEKWEKVSSRADAAIALVTPDDEGALVKGKAPRARQNVWLEVGYVWGRLDRSRFLLLQKGEVERPSDLHGLEYYSYRKDPSERSNELRKFIESVRDE